MYNFFYQKQIIFPRKTLNNCNFTMIVSEIGIENNFWCLVGTANNFRGWLLNMTVFFTMRGNGISDFDWKLHFPMSVGLKIRCEIIFSFLSTTYFAFFKKISPVGMDAPPGGTSDLKSHLRRWRQRRTLKLSPPYSCCKLSPPQLN